METGKPFASCPMRDGPLTGAGQEADGHEIEPMGWRNVNADAQSGRLHPLVGGRGAPLTDGGVDRWGRRDVIAVAQWRKKAALTDGDGGQREACPQYARPPPTNQQQMGRRGLRSDGRGPCPMGKGDPRRSSNGEGGCRSSW
ncbi:hypothetical protein chiPu_0021500 [Chiloscyllium punctatum]|uniref:Uncharacterized protein n=1 Tax=Chiloscyllium punctatum TaxID=137246 RepID=A0A401RGA0_CHIPU|nr:hypothetical protein [Chiloscyllium punctatum]